jgi:hypothetical protein
MQEQCLGGKRLCYYQTAAYNWGEAAFPARVQPVKASLLELAVPADQQHPTRIPYSGEVNSGVK